jgi:flagella basal body P-ring formation protein FlgA
MAKYMVSKDLLSGLLLAISCWAGALPAAWGEEIAPQSPQAILSAILSFLQAQPQPPEVERRIEVAPLEARLPLPNCSLPLEAFFPQGGRDRGAVSVGVRCAGERPWSIYHRAHIYLYKSVVVLKNSVLPGHILQPDDLALAPKELSTLRDYYAAPNQALGKPVKRALPAGSVLGPQHLTALLVVRRGQSIAIRAYSAGFEVSMAGVALMDGAAGQRIRARNAQSGRIIEGVINPNGQLIVGR